MIQRPTAVHIPTPCREPWAAMTPTGNGRHCAKCQTEVVDFTRLTEAEVLAYLAARPGQRVCARMTALLVPTHPKRLKGSRRWLSALLTASSLSALLLPKAAARVSVALSYTSLTHSSQVSLPENLPSQEAPESAEALEKRIAANPILVHGVVLDAHTHQPLPGVTVLLQGTRWGISTNTAGEFELTVTSRGRHIKLVAASVGYRTVAKTISVKESNQKITFLLEPDTTMLGRITVPAKPYGGFLPKLRALRWFS